MQFKPFNRFAPFKSFKAFTLTLDLSLKGRG